MTGWQLGRFLIAAMLAAVVGHLMWAVVAAAALRALYPHRIYDVRQWSDNAVESFRLVGTFLVEKTAQGERPVIVFAGSSVTFGHQFPADAIFTRRFADRHPSASVLNVSIIAADVSAVNDWIVCAARRNRIRVSTLIVELPVVNSLTYLVKGHQSGHPPPPLSVCNGGDADRGYLRFALTTFRGTGWFGFFWRRHALLGGDAPIRIERVPKGYFATAADFAPVRGQFASQIATTLRNAKAVADVVYAFPSPVFVAGLSEVDEDPHAIRSQLDAALAACRSVPATGCIDPASLYDESRYFSNFTHLNHAGHRAMADLLNAQVSAR